MEEILNEVLVLWLMTQKQVLLAVTDSISQMIFFFHLLFGFGKKIFIQSFSFFVPTRMGCSIPFRGFIKPVCTQTEDEHGLCKKLTTP